MKVRHCNRTRGEGKAWNVPRESRKTAKVRTGAYLRRDRHEGRQ